MSTCGTFIDYVFSVYTDKNVSGLSIEINTETKTVIILILFAYIYTSIYMTQSILVMEDIGD